MASAIDATKPADAVPAVKSEMRANFLTAKNEITALQAALPSGLYPRTNRTGSMAGVATGLAHRLTGNVTAVPITDGWMGKFDNKSGSDKTITPASGTIIKTKDGTAPAFITLSHRKECTAHADGTDLWISGDVT